MVLRSPAPTPHVTAFGHTRRHRKPPLERLIVLQRPPGALSPGNSPAPSRSRSVTRGLSPHLPASATVGCRPLFPEPTPPQRRLRRRYRPVAPTPGRQSDARVSERSGPSSEYCDGHTGERLVSSTPSCQLGQIIVIGRVVPNRLGDNMSQLRKRFDSPQDHPGASCACAHHSDIGSGHWPRAVVATVRPSPRYRRGQRDVELIGDARVYLQRGKVIRICRIREPVHLRLPSRGGQRYQAVVQ